MDFNKTLPVVILFHRKQSGLSQAELAEMSGVGKTVIYDIENGKMTIRFLTLLNVLKVLNIKIKFESPLMKIFEGTLHEKS